MPCLFDARHPDVSADNSCTDVAFLELSGPGVPRAHHSAAWFHISSITTIVYAWMVNSGLPIAGFNLVILIIAVLLDAGSHGSGAGYYRRRRV